MELKGKITKVFPAEQVTDRNGAVHNVQNFNVLTEGQYPKTVHCRVFGDEKIAKFNVQPNTDVTVGFDLSSRPWTDSKGQERWSTSVDVWSVKTNSAAYAPQGYAPQPQGYAPQPYAPQPQAPGAPFPPQPQAQGYAPQPQYAPQATQYPPQPQAQGYAPQPQSPFSPQPQTPQAPATPFPPADSNEDRPF